MRRIRVAVAAATVGGTAFFTAAPMLITPAQADPITCPSGQTATKTSSGWQCINGGDNSTGAARHQGNGNKI